MNRVFGTLYADYYELLYKDKDYAGEVEYLVELLGQVGVRSEAGVRSILELGCGTGRHAELLAGRGYSVYGVDRSTDMLETARRRGAGNPHLTFSLGDVTSVEVGKHFDVVLSLFHVLSYQISNSEVEAMFRTASNHLKPGGTVVFDFWHGPGVLTDRPAVRVRRFEGQDVTVLRISEPTMHPELDAVDVNFTVQIRRKGEAMVTEAQEAHRMRYFAVPELEYFMAKTGLELVSAVPWMKTEGNLGCGDWYGVVVGRRI